MLYYESPIGPRRMDWKMCNILEVMELVHRKNVEYKKRPRKWGVFNF